MEPIHTALLIGLVGLMYLLYKWEVTLRNTILEIIQQALRETLRLNWDPNLENGQTRLIRKGTNSFVTVWYLQRTNSAPLVERIDITVNKTDVIFFYENGMFVRVDRCNRSLSRLFFTKHLHERANTLLTYVKKDLKIASAG